MKTLTEVFNSVRDSMHWGPSLEPFYLAIIERDNEKDARISALEAERAEDKKMMDELRNEYAVMAMARAQLIKQNTATDETSQVDETNPAEPVQTPVPDLLEASPEPVPAGPDASEVTGDPVVDTAPEPTDDHPVPTE